MKEFTFKTLTSDQLFNFCEVLDAIGIDAFTDIFSKENLAEFKDSEDYEDLLKELNNYDNNSIVVINYDHMGYLGYSIDEFTRSDIIYIESKESE